MQQHDMDYVDHCCRICLADLKFGGGIKIFGDQGRKEMLPYKIRRYLCITVNVDDQLPKEICNTCYRRVNAICRFSLQAIKNQKELTTHYKNRQGVRGLLHAYLTNDIKVEREEDGNSEHEDGVDPMMVVQCSLGEGSDTQPEENFDVIEKPLSNHTTPKLFYAHYPAEVQIWTSTGHTKRILLNKNHAEVEIYADFSGSSIDTPPPPRREQHTCPVCGKVATSKENLKVHVETHRPKGKYDCNKCGRVFKTLCNLHRHQECHAEEEGNKYRCQTCGRLYTSNSTLRAHSITHSDVRPHKCPHCVKTFKRNQDLKFHINQHTGARPYQCPYCPKAFASSGNCFSHRKRMHPIEVERDRERAAKIMR